MCIRDSVSTAMRNGPLVCANKALMRAGVKGYWRHWEGAYGPLKERMKASKEVWRDFLLQHYEGTRLSILRCGEDYRGVE
eukprot:11996375-Heterocapsa_arctica.AAC.1